MVWWGWMVTNFTGTMYFTQVTDDDFELWIHPTDFNRPDTEGATRVIQGNNWRPWFYGSYDVTKGTVYHTKMYMGEGGGGDDSVFYWNTTGPASAAGFGHSGGDNREQWPGSTGTMENFSYLDGTVEDTGKSGNSSWPTGGIPDLPGGDLPNAGDDPTDGDFALWFTTREKAEAYIASLSGGGGGGASVIANPLTSVDRNYNSNWVISVDKWDSYRSIGYQGNLDVAPIQAASVIAGGGGFDGSFNVVDASFRTQGDASSNWFSSSHPAQMAFNNDISFVEGQYFAVENVSAYQNGTIVSDSDNSAVKLDFLFPYPRTATEYEILPPNEISNNDALYMPNRWCIYGSKSETIDTTLPSTESNGYFLLDSRADAKPWSAHDASLISVSGGKKYIIANPGLYRQYRMSILQNSGDPAGNINIGELIYYEGGVGPLVGGGALDGRSDLSGGLAFHGDVSGINGLEPIIINNYTVDVSLNRFTLNDDLQPELTLYRGETYNFNQSDIDNSGQRLFVSNDISGRIGGNNTTIVKLAGAGGIYTTGGSKHSTTPATFQLNSNAHINNNIHGSANASYSFDNNVTNINMTMSNSPSNHIINNSSNIEFGIIIIFPTQVIVNKYKMWSRRHLSGGGTNDARPRAWTLRATNNLSTYVLNTSSSYTELDNISNVQHADWPTPDDNSLTNDDKYVEYSFTNTNAYSVYILNFTECNRSDYIAVSEIAYYGIDGASAVTTSGGLSDNSAGFITTGTLGTDLSSSWTIPTDAPDTMYYTSDGSANAGGIINIANIANIPNYNIVNLFDGSDNSLYKSPIGAFENYDLSAGKEFAVKFELPSKKKILKYDIKNTNIKSWTLRGCDNSAIYDRTDSNTYELLHGVSDFIDSSKSCIVSNPKDYTYYVLDVSSSNITDSAELGELIYYDTGSYPSAGAGSLDGSSGDVGGLLIHGDVEGVGGQSDWAALSGGLGAHGDISGVNGFEPLINYTVDVSLNRFTLNGELQPELTLYRGTTYNFNQSNIDNSGHELFISTNSGSANNSTRYPITPLTSNNSNNCIVTESSLSDSNKAGWKAFNHTNTNQDDCWHASGAPAGYTSGIANNSRSFNGINGDWVKIQFTNGGFPLKEIQIYQRNDAGNSAWYMFADRCVDDGYIYGSNDGSNWSQLKYFTGLKGSGWVSGTPKTIDVNSNISYSYYVLLVTKLSGSEAILNIGQIDLYEALATPYTTGFTNNGGTSGTDLISSWTIPNDISDIMYYASDGSGADAGGIINIQNYTNYDVSNVYDGSNITVYKSPIGAFDNYDLSAGKEFAVKMDFPSSKKILRYDLNNINLKSWTLRGTDNSVNYDRTDSNTYEVLDSNVDFSYVVSNNSGNSGNSSNSGFSNTVDSFLGGVAGLSGLESSITLWIDGTNIDGTNNSSYSNGNNITLWKDLSSKGNDLEPRNNPTFLYNGGPSGSNKAVVNFTDDAFRTSGHIYMNIIFLVHKTKNEDFLFDFRDGNGSYVWTGGGGVNWTVHKNGTNTKINYNSSFQVH